jgi:hypothetical protein
MSVSSSEDMVCGRSPTDRTSRENIALASGDVAVMYLRNTREHVQHGRENKKNLFDPNYATEKHSIGRCGD